MHGHYEVDYLCVPAKPPSGAVEKEAEKAMYDGVVTWAQLEKWMCELPDEPLVRGDSTAGTDQHGLPPKVFTVGAFSHASWHGLRTHTMQFPWLTCLG